MVQDSTWHYWGYSGILLFYSGVRNTVHLDNSEPLQQLLQNPARYPNLRSCLKMKRYTFPPAGLVEIPVSDGSQEVMSKGVQVVSHSHSAWQSTFLLLSSNFVRPIWCRTFMTLIMLICLVNVILKITLQLIIEMSLTPGFLYRKR